MKDSSIYNKMRAYKTHYQQAARTLDSMAHLEGRARVVYDHATHTFAKAGWSLAADPKAGLEDAAIVLHRATLAMRDAMREIDPETNPEVMAKINDLNQKLAGKIALANQAVEDRGEMGERFTHIATEEVKVLSWAGLGEQESSDRSAVVAEGYLKGSLHWVRDQVGVERADTGKHAVAEKTGRSFWERITPQFVRNIQKKVRKQVFHGFSSTDRRRRLEERLARAKRDYHKAMEAGPDSSEAVEALMKVRDLEVDVEEMQAQTLGRAKATRQQLVGIGGTELRITTSDEVNIEGMYMSAEAFRTKLADAGGFVTKVTRTFEDGEVRVLNAIAFHRDDYDAANVVEMLTDLGAFPNWGDPDRLSHGAGMTTIIDGDHILLVRRDEVAPFELDGVEDPRGFVREIDGFLHTTLPPEDCIQTSEDDREALRTPKQPAVVLLSSGSAGVLEMHKREIIAYLLRGLDVVAINPRGYGGSEGIPSDEGLYRDYQATLDYVQTEKKIPDERIILKALCMTGGVAAHILRPKMHAFFDQTYSDISSMVRDLAAEQMPENLPGFMKSMVGAVAAKAISPAFEVTSKLADREGQTCFFFVRDDDLISREHVEQNVEAAMVTNPRKLMVASSPGQHSDSWVSMHNPGYVHLDVGRRIMEIDNLLAFPDDLEPEQIARYEEEREALLAPIDDGLKKWVYNGEQMMDRFLERTGLSDPLIPSKTTEMAALRNERKQLEARRQHIITTIGELQETRAKIEEANQHIAKEMATSSRPEGFVKRVEALSLDLDIITTDIERQQRTIQEEIEPRLAAIEDRYQILRS